MNGMPDYTEKELIVINALDWAEKEGIKNSLLIARRIEKELQKIDNKPNLGCATTRVLIDEIRARIEVDGQLDYRTIDN